MKHFNTTLFLLIWTSSLASPARAADENLLIVHEWGTFTSLQNDRGEAIAGVNTDDEPVPSFVHNIGAIARSDSQLTPVFNATMTKGSVPMLHPDVTMRLETPVVYFYLPRGAKSLTADLTVSFRGGWLSQYYPEAESNTTESDVISKHITYDTVGTLTWKNLRIGSIGEGPVTTDKVWLAPRAVNASAIATASGEHEKFLFYRGVGKMGNADYFPMVAGRDTAGVTLTLNLNNSDKIKSIPSWLVDVREDGKIAYRPAGTPESVSKNIVHYGKFTEASYSLENLDSLEKDLHAALAGAGLFDDEATAMLKTWERSYFRLPGERIFYLVPRPWIDASLPMNLSVPTSVTRVMLGRIELVSPAQKLALEKMKTDSIAEMASFIKNGTSKDKDWALFAEIAEGKKPIEMLDRKVPQIYNDYLRLGRFRDAILLDENKRHPSPALEEFIRGNQINMYKIREATSR